MEPFLGYQTPGRSCPTALNDVDRGTFVPSDNQFVPGARQLGEPGSSMLQILAGDHQRLPQSGTGERGHNALDGLLPIQDSTDEEGDFPVVGTTATGAGAGPLPTGFGAPAGLGSGSVLSEFTKRRNWSQRILEELKDFLHILSSDGCILYVSRSSEVLTGFQQHELVGKFIVDFIHSDDSGIFVREFNESIASGNPLRFFYRFRRADGSYTIFEAQGHPHLTSEPGENGSMSNCRGFFMMARPYPTKNARLLDSFLEHKMENERLMRRINDLRREERDEIEEQQRRLTRRDEGHGSATPSDTQRTESETQGSVSMTSGHSHNGFRSMPPPAKPGILGNALTQQNLDEANASSKPDSINDKMARYEGVTHLDAIEMLTGLQYRDGERSRGISTGDAHPTLIRGDAGISIPADKADRFGDRKKKLKVADEYVCTDCGTLDSPEWRKGPSGPKTLCNACGLRWAKKEKKERIDPLECQSPPRPAEVS